jgi:hypothetical protein
MITVVLFWTCMGLLSLMLHLAFLIRFGRLLVVKRRVEANQKLYFGYLFTMVICWPLVIPFIGYLWSKQHQKEMRHVV